MTSTGGTIATVQSMEVSRLCNNQSDQQSLTLVTGARASVASCLNTIARNLACFTRLLAGGFARATRCRAHGLWLCQPSRKNTVLKSSHRQPSCFSINSSWICRVSNWVLAASSDFKLQ